MYPHVIHLTNRFQVAVRLFSDRSQMTSKCGKNKKVAHDAQPSVALMFLPFDVICDLLLNRHTATWNLFVLYNKELKYSLEICRVEGSLKARVFFSKYCPLIAECIIFRVYTTVIYLK